MVDQRGDDRHRPPCHGRARLGRRAHAAAGQRESLVILEPAQIQQVKLHPLSPLKVSQPGVSILSTPRPPNKLTVTPTEYSTYFRPRGLEGIEALHARFVQHAYRPHSHPTWTVAMVERGAARFELDATQQRAAQGELFVLEPDAIHTGMAAVPEGWAYKVLYIEPSVVHEWAQRDGNPPRAARWVVFRDVALRAALERAHTALRTESAGSLAVEEAVLGAVAALRPHLKPGPPARARDRAEHAAVRRAREHLRECWDQRVSLAELATVAGLSRFELVRRFREQNDVTPHAFQTNLRVAEARRMLAAGAQPAAVAAACGFADQPHLTRVFKRAVGVSPGRYVRAAAS
jgi:AraC-like DNA-binding protein